jgi:hypothetical protein
LRLSARSRIFVTIAATALVVVLAAMLSPYIYAEYEFNLLGQAPTALPKPAVPVAGRWFDDYFVVETVDPSTFAIGEPRYYHEMRHASSTNIGARSLNTYNNFISR